MTTLYVWASTKATKTSVCPKSCTQPSHGLEQKHVCDAQTKLANQGAWGEASPFFLFYWSPESEKDILTNLLFLFLFEFCLCYIRKQLFKRERSVYINPEDKPPEMMIISNAIFKVADYILFDKKTPSSSSCTQNIGHTNNFFNIFIQIMPFHTSLSNGMKA